MIPINIINPVAGIKVIVWRHRWSDISNVNTPAQIFVVIKDFELVVMRMAKELRGDRRLITVNNGVVVP